MTDSDGEKRGGDSATGFSFINRWQLNSERKQNLHLQKVILIVRIKMLMGDEALTVPLKDVPVKQ